MPLELQTSPPPQEYELDPDPVEQSSLPHAVRKVAVIGAGPAGLVTAKTCEEAGFKATIFEATAVLGGAFANGSMGVAGYDKGALVSSKYLTAFSDYRSPQTARSHLTFEEYGLYLNNYAKDFKIDIRFSTPIQCVEPCSEGGYNVTFLVSGNPVTQQFDAVAVCSGVHNTPLIPAVPGLDSFAGEILHSSAYKDMSQLRGKRVLVVGSQETAMDVGYRCVKAPTAATTMVVRRGFLSVPHVFGGEDGEPLDTLITNAFEATWQHRWMEMTRVKWEFTTVAIRVGFFLGSGTSIGWNQWAGRVRFVKRGFNYITKATDVMPYINRWAKAKLPWWRTALWSYLDCESDGAPLTPGIQVDVRRGNWSVMPGTKRVEFHDEARDESANPAPGSPTTHHVAEYDTMVLCTGYRQRFPFLKNCGGAKGEPMPAEPTTASAKPTPTPTPKSTPTPTAGDVKKPKAVLAAPRLARDGARSPTSVLTGGYGGAASTLPLLANDEGVRDGDGKGRGVATAGGADVYATSLGDQRWKLRDHPLPDQHFITARGAPALGFIGFARPNVGAIPPIAEMQAMWWCARLATTSAMKKDVAERKERFQGFIPCRRGNWGRSVYKLLAGKHQYAVDYGYYMHELAIDLGTVPSLNALLRRPRAFWGYGFGQAFTPWFRLTGPWATEGAWDICCGELFQTTLGRGLPANLNFVLMNIVLGSMNAACWLVDRALVMPLYALMPIGTHPAMKAPYPE